MKVAPITNNYNVSSKGQFKNSKLLQESIKYATTKELAKFNKILEHANLVDDKKVFMLTKRVEEEFIPVLSKKVEVVYADFYCDDNSNVKKMAEIRGGYQYPYYKVFPTVNKILEKFYNNPNERTNLLEDISKKLL